MGMNILVYSDQGASPVSFKHTFNTLKSILGNVYDIIQIDRKVLQSEPWESGCVMLVMPGGRDMPYCEALDGEPNARIKAFIQQGGKYLGLCAGSYYASANIEFEKGNKWMEICQPRELDFFPGVCRGTVYPGFIYNSENGARSVTVSLVKNTLAPYYSQVPDEIKMYYNGGGYFAHPEKYNNVTVLSRYKEPSTLCNDEPDGPAAVVHCKVGSGDALLIATHPEYDITSDDLLYNDGQGNIKTILSDLVISEVERKKFLRAAFARIGLNVVPVENDTVHENRAPKITPMYLCGLTKQWVYEPLSYLLKRTDPIHRIMEDKHDIFHLIEAGCEQNEKAKLLSMCREKEEKSPVINIVYQNMTDAIEPIYPTQFLTPHFNLSNYFDSLINQRRQSSSGAYLFTFGSSLLYTEVIESTQSIIDRNFKFSQALPTGLVCLATTQIAGRGRGRNSWVSQNGALQFSIIIRHSVDLRHAPVVFIQYIIALAVTESIRSRPGYEDVPLRLKWPNDVYIETKDKGLKKVGGLLITSSFVDNHFVLVIGCGINLSNSEPTVSINDIIQEQNSLLPRLSAEDVLAGILVKFEMYYNQFCKQGMGSWFLDLYYKRWLHSDVIVTLTTQNNEKVKVKGITADYGMLKVESIEKPGKTYGLLPNGNSFDMMNGLIIQKKL